MRKINALYYNKQNDKIIFYSSKNTISHIIVFLSNGNYKYVRFHPRRVSVKLITSDAVDILKKIIDSKKISTSTPNKFVWVNFLSQFYYGKTIVSLFDYVADVVNKENMKRLVKESVKTIVKHNNNNIDDMYGSVQYFELLDKYFIDVEKTVTKEKLYKLLTVYDGISIGVFNEFFGMVELNNINDDDIIRHKKWYVMYDETIKFKLDEIVDFLDETERKLKQFKNKLAYGKVVILKKLKRNVMADYNHTDDSIRIKKTRNYNNKTIMYNMLHELGHRYIRKFMSSEQLRQIKDVFYSMSGNRKKFKLGETVITERGILQIIKKKSDGYVVKIIESFDNKLKEKSWYSFPDSLIQQLTSRNPFFVTNYARTNPEEMFCEIFATYLTSNLDVEVEEWFKHITK